MGVFLIVSSSQTYLMGNIKTQLEELHHKVYKVDLKLSDLYESMKEIDGIVLYIEEDYQSKMQELLYIKDRAIEMDYPVFLLGNGTDMDKLIGEMGSTKIPMKFPRPIDVKKVAADIDIFLKNHDKSNKKKILVVDDSGAVLRNVKGWLEDKYAVTLANSGTTAIKSLSLNRPDLVLLDYEMPVVDGAQVLEMIRSENDFCDIPVIFLTSKGDKESVMKVMALKPEGYLLKTLPPSKIIEAVDEFFEKQKMKKM